MDRDISPGVRRRKRIRLLLILAGTAIVVIAAVFWLRSGFTSSVKSSAILTSVVEIGDVEQTITASGEVLPEFETIITSPVQAAILEVLADAGSEVQTGDAILKLDQAGIEGDYEKARFLLESKQNDLRKLKLELNRTYFDLQSNNEIKALEINNKTAAVQNAQRLYEAGGGTRESVEQAEMELKVARLEKTRLENEIKSKQQTMQVDIRESEIALNIQRQELAEFGRKKEKARVVAPRSGVVTWVNRNIGAAVGEGAELARIADLSSFKISGSISDAYLQELKNGMPVIIRINNRQIRGVITNIFPAVQDGLVRFDVRPQARDGLLRPNLKVDVYVITDSHEKVMRVKNGPAFGGGSVQDVFIVKNGKAERRKITKGLSNFDYMEIKDNVKPGEKLITSDMSAFKNVSEIIITQ